MLESTTLARLKSTWEESCEKIWSYLHVLAIRAVHIEVASSVDTDSCINAF